MSHPEFTRLRHLATKYRQRNVELEQMFSTYVGGSIKRLMAARSANPHEYQSIEDRLKIVKVRGDLLEVFVRNDVDHKNAMSYDEFKNAMVLMGFMNDESTIKRTFHKMDKNIDEMISEGEFLSGVIGKMHTEEHSFKSQIDFLNNEIKQAELKSAEDNDEIEKLLLENESLREKNPGEAEAEIDRLRRLIQEMQDTHNDLQRQLKEEMDREIHRLREFGTAMRNQLNLLQRESVVGARTAIRKVMGMSGADEGELDEFDRETERSHLIAQVRQVFINLDEAHMGDLDFDKFTQAYQWLNLSLTSEQLRRTFNQLDEKNTGLVTEEQFLSAVISDMDPAQYTGKNQFDSLMERMGDFDDRLNELVGGDASKMLRGRLDNMKREMDNRVGRLFDSMKGMTGMDIMDVISPEVLEKHLTDAFNKFDYTRDGRLELKEFGKAWEELGLTASPEELQESFNTVDTNSSGYVDRSEFIAAVKDNRLPELNMNLLMEAMGVQLGSISDRFNAFSNTQRRRRGQRKTMEATLAERLSEMVTVLSQITGKTRDDDAAELNREMRETFDRFDRNGSGELNLEEYKKAWKFLGRPGSDNEIDTAFQGVDIDNSGFIEWEEFVFSLQGEDAQKYGLLADMERMLALLAEVHQDLMQLRGERTDSQKELISLRERLAMLQRETTNKTETLVQRMKRVSGERDSIYLDDLDEQLRKAFSAADKHQSGSLNVWQFSQAWMSLGLGGNEDELKDYFSSVDRLGGSGKGMDVRQFMRVVKNERLAELSLRSRLATLEYLFGKIEGTLVSRDTTSARRRLQRQKQDEDTYALVSSMVEAVLPCTDDQLSPNYIAKRQRYQELRDAFSQYDNPTTGTLDVKQFKAARRACSYNGSEQDLEAQFNSVDADRSGGVDVNEFIISDMGKKAMKVGSLGYVKILNKLVNTATERMKRGAPIGAGDKSPTDQRKVTKLNARKMVQRMTGFGGLDQKKLESWGIKDRRAHSITAGMLEHILHD